jgi:hypothetical protein
LFSSVRGPTVSSVERSAAAGSRIGEGRLRASILCKPQELPLVLRMRRYAYDRDALPPAVAFEKAASVLVAPGNLTRVGRLPVVFRTQVKDAAALVLVPRADFGLGAHRTGIGLSVAGRKAKASRFVFSAVIHRERRGRIFDVSEQLYNIGPPLDLRRRV